MVYTLEYCVMVAETYYFKVRTFFSNYSLNLAENQNLTTLA